MALFSLLLSVPLGAVGVVVVPSVKASGGFPDRGEVKVGTFAVVFPTPGVENNTAWAPGAGVVAVVTVWEAGDETCGAG